VRVHLDQSPTRVLVWARPAPGLRSRATPPIFTPVGESSASSLDRVFSAISDPTRRAILARLADSDARVTDVAGAFPISLNSTSKHIRMLEGAGLVRRKVRGREHILTLDAAPLSEAAGWIEHYRTFWSDQLASLDAFVSGRNKTKKSS
jgi:DNA-binding transcriptional ArsR family regulator